MKTIPLSQGKVAIIDDSDYANISEHNWCAAQSRHTFYAQRRVPVAKYNQRTEFMHRTILGLQPGDNQETDHVDGNGLNNRRDNLRVCTVAQNQQSSRKQKGCTSKYKGVYWNRHARKWLSHIWINGRQTHLGLFDLETNAARAYDSAAIKHYGDFALTNEMMGLLQGAIR